MNEQNNTTEAKGIIYRNISTLFTKDYCERHHIPERDSSIQTTALQAAKLIINKKATKVTITINPHENIVLKSTTKPERVSIERNINKKYKTAYDELPEEFPNKPTAPKQGTLPYER